MGIESRRTDTRRIFLGFTPAEWKATDVARASLARWIERSAHVYQVDYNSRLLIPEYGRETVVDPAGQLIDVVSDAPMSTDHAISRFFVPYLCGYQGWALFTDGDVIFRRSVDDLFDRADPAYAVHVVQHPALLDTTPKKAGHVQLTYPRKNWSSVMLFNCAHPAHERLTLDGLQQTPGRDLHAFCWLRDEEIGSLPKAWNFLVGIDEPLEVPDPAIVHFTLGTPDLPEHANDLYADEWWQMATSVGIRRS